MTRRRWIYLAAAVCVAVAMTVVLTHWRGIAGQTRPHHSIGTQAHTLREAFNADVGKVRIVALVSPTCGACLRGATDLQAHVFGRIDHQLLRGHIVWVPKLDGREAHVPEATRTISDPRATHYWDADSYLVHAYDTTLGLGEDAWDVYLLYGPDTRWDGPQPPVPLSWTHQLPGITQPTLDPDKLADQVRAQLP